MKNKTGIIAAICVLLCLAGGLVVAMVFGIKHFSLPSFHFGANDAPLVFDENYDFESTKAILTKTEATDVKIIRSQDDKINIKVYATKDKVVKTEENDGAINISVEGHCVGFCIGLQNNRVEVSLPESYAGTIRFESDAGDIKSDGFGGASFEINTSAGDVEIASAKSVNVNSNSGDVELGEVENISIQINAGDIDINKCFGELFIRASAGDIKINELQLSKDASIEADAGDIKIVNAGNTYVDAHADFGDVKVNNNGRNAEFELKIRTNAGDIKVN